MIKEQNAKGTILRANQKAPSYPRFLSCNQDPILNKRHKTQLSIFMTVVSLFSSWHLFYHFVFLSSLSVYLCRPQDPQKQCQCLAYLLHLIQDEFSCGMYRLHAREVPIHVRAYINICLEYKITISPVLNGKPLDLFTNNAPGKR